LVVWLVVALTGCAAVASAAAVNGTPAPPFPVASTLDGKTVLPQRIRWLGRTSLTAATSPRRSLDLVAVGDSLPFGQQDCGFCATFVDQFGKALGRATGAKVNVSNLSEHTGIDSADLRMELTASKALRTAIAGAEAITVTIGHNDPPWNRDDDPCDGAGGYPDANWSKYDASCVRQTTATYASNLEAILREIRALRTGKPTLLRVTNDYDDLIGDPVVPKSAYAIAKPFFDTDGMATCRIAKKYKAVCIDTYHAFNGAGGTRDAGALLAGDHTHPSARGHALIARLLSKAGYAPLHR
jgi:lysophospholipase L1-like esterase